MVKSFSFIVLTHFFQFNELNFKATRLLTFFKLNHQYFLQCNKEINLLQPSGVVTTSTNRG